MSDTSQTEFLTVKEVARILKVNGRTVLKLAQTGQLPAVKIASQWRFSPELVRDHLHSQMKFGFVLGRPVQREARITHYLITENIKLSLQSATKPDVIREMVQLVEKSGFLKNAHIFRKAVMDRERMCSTGIGRGIALLHTRRIVPDLIERPFIAICRSGGGVDFDAVDGTPVYIFFLLGLDQEELHLRILSKISNMFMKSEMLSRFRGAGSPEELMELIREQEGQDWRNRNETL